jgi:predicted kinase
MVALISGVPGAGKSTVSRILARSWPKSVHLEGDRIGEEFIVNGMLFPGEEPVEESDLQLRLRRRNICLLADSFAGTGFSVVIDDVILWPGGLRFYREQLHTRPLRFILLAPDIEVVGRRDAGRDKHVFEFWRHLDADMRGWTDQPGLRIDTSTQTAEGTVETILNRWDDALVDGPPG